MDETLWQYLEENGKFHSPPTGVGSTSTTDINDLDADALDEHWKPKEARRDDRMVDSLLVTLRDWLNDRTLPRQQFQSFFQPFADMQGNHPDWRRINDNELNASRLVSAGALSALEIIMGLLGCPITRSQEVAAPFPVFNSRVDFALFTSDDVNKKILVEIKAPSVLQHAIIKMANGSFRLRLNPGAPSEERVINKLCLYMAAHRVHWAAITSHDRWVFFRLHPDPDADSPEPYVSFSTVEEQTNNTRPFCALLAMMVATAFDRNVESHANSAMLPEIKDDDDDEDDTPQTDPEEDKSGSFRGSGKGGRDNKPFTRQDAKDATRVAGLGAQTSESTDLVMCWSTAVVRKPKLFTFSEIGRTAQRLSLGAGTVRLSLQRVIGTGLTGVVYEANRIGNKLSSQSYAVKVIVKDSFKGTEKACYIDQLLGEFEVYCKIERAKQNGDVPTYVTPRCYGLYESETMLALLMDYEGTALLDEDWDSLQYSEKTQIFRLVAALHKIGIGHCDLEPRNILRTSTSFKIIDFGFASFHKCPGITEVRWTKSASRRECAELKSLWNQLGVEPEGIAGLG